MRDDGYTCPAEVFHKPDEDVGDRGFRTRPLGQSESGKINRNARKLFGEERNLLKPRERVTTRAVKKDQRWTEPIHSIVQICTAYDDSWHGDQRNMVRLRSRLAASEALFTIGTH
jgi:hypothetical protein